MSQGEGGQNIPFNNDKAIGEMGQMWATDGLPVIAS